jgi:hypothetical protein
VEEIGPRLEDVDEYFAGLKKQLVHAKQLVEDLENEIESYYIANKIKMQFRRPAMPCRP